MLRLESVLMAFGMITTGNERENLFFKTLSYQNKIRTTQ